VVKDSTFARPTSWIKETSTQERANNETQISPRLFPATGKGRRALILQKVLHDKIVEVLNIQRGKKFTWLFQFRGKHANIHIWWKFFVLLLFSFNDFSDLPIIYKCYNIYYLITSIFIKYRSKWISSLRNENSRVNLFPHVFSCHM